MGGLQLQGDPPPEACRMADGRSRIFAYGTLMTGYHNHHWLEEADLLGAASTLGKFQMYARNPKNQYYVGIPFISTVGGSAAVQTPAVNVRGECYAVTDV